MRAQSEYQSLAEAFLSTEPACLRDDRYTLDREALTEDETTQMRRTCRTCPLFALCDAYATAGRPEGGFWAGDHRTAKQRMEAGS